MSSAKAASMIPVDGVSFFGTLHDNVSNQQRQGSGFTPLKWKGQENLWLYRRDAVGLNFEHIFNGTRAQNEISMFTPREDPCQIQALGQQRYQILWPAEGSQWGIKASMVYDFSHKDQIDMVFSCTPTIERFSMGFAAMMWASYMHRCVDRRIHFWGAVDGIPQWTSFGEDLDSGFETGTVAHIGAEPLPYEQGAQILNLVEHPQKSFITPFYYGLLENPRTDTPLLYLVFFDQTESIRFAMWNFMRDPQGQPDTHSPAWDWQYVIQEPVRGTQYGYRARVVVKPFQGEDQIKAEYLRWQTAVDLPLPALP
ncbi:MAG: hypothetical protein P8L18_02290 [Verrucomicrobiota bacterium]|nr:hypothetical protein [Verrucomicrobiota bacterium]